MNGHGRLRRAAEEAKRKELMDLLFDYGVEHHSDGRRLAELSLEELQDKFRKVGKYE